MSNQHDGCSQLPLSRGPVDPSEYSSPDVKARFAIAKYYGMGSDGQWSVKEIAEALGVTPPQVYNYLNESEIGREVKAVVATTVAKWRLDAAMHLWDEVERLEPIEQELLQQKTSIPIDYEGQPVKGTPTDAEQVVL